MWQKTNVEWCFFSLFFWESLKTYPNISVHIGIHAGRILVKSLHADGAKSRNFYKIEIYELYLWNISNLLIFNSLI